MRVRFGSILNPDFLTYKLDISKVSFSFDNRHFLFLDQKTGRILSFNSYGSAATPMDADTLNATGLVAKAMHFLGGDFGLMIPLIAAIAGLAFGFIIGQNIEGITQAFSG